MTANAIRRGATTTLDTLLDVLVVPGYSSIGPALRRRWWAPDAVPFVGHPDIVVTGGSSGLGEATALGLATLGAKVHLVGRSADRLDAAANRIRAALPTADLAVHESDVSDLAAVDALVVRLRTAITSLHALVHCAGLIPADRTLSAQGHEMAFSTHVLGPFALTFGLRGLLQADGDARVIWVSSGGMYSASLVRDLEYADGEYSGVRAYARTKRMQVTLAELMGAQFAGSTDPVVHSMHPGWAATAGVSGSIPGFARLTKPILRTPAQGADTIVWLAAAGQVTATTGKFWHDRRIRPTHYLPWQHDDPAARADLWQTCLEATRLSS